MGSRVGSSPLFLFFYFVCIYGLSFHLKCSFKSILEKKSRKFFLRDPSFVYRTWNVYRSVPIPRSLFCPQKILGRALITLLPGAQLLLDSQRGVLFWGRRSLNISKRRNILRTCIFNQKIRTVIITEKIKCIMYV